METQRKKLTKGIVAAAVAQIGKRELTLSDEQSKGLSLRVRKTSAIWCLRARFGPKQTTWRVGDASVMEDPDTARENVAEAWKLIRRGIDPEEKLRELENDGLTERYHDRARDGWDWKEARDRYLVHVKENLAPATYKDYRIALHSGDLKPLEGKLVRQIGPEDAKRIRNAVHERGVPAQSRHVLSILQACMSWVAEQTGSGIDVSLIAGVKPLPRGKATKRRVHLPSEAELGLLPWRLEAAPISAQSRLAGLLMLLTVQRVETVISARRQDFRELESGLVWAIPAEHIKAKRCHVVPLPPATADVARQALALPAPGDWLFPQVRPRRKGGPCDGHISYHPVAEPLDPLDPHDFRHAFGTYGPTRLGIKPVDLAAIMHHVREQGPRMTVLVYGRPDELEIQIHPLRNPNDARWVTMRKWEDWILGLAISHCPAPGARMRTLDLRRSA
ncbi:tyrosine-type recombinase/integrase [Siccirubricoccus phaeus]|uniref:tyrosine-type recombinase/integrase n=1 Tax=Siccirubricoccus phaeus TaxID=2595053 RepID=UPI0011F2AB79|nr:integrase arm-type DNA-binding domain-containing protein [Siccirubricoccus phaeus]